MCAWRVAHNSKCSGPCERQGQLLGRRRRCEPGPLTQLHRSGIGNHCSPLIPLLRCRDVPAAVDDGRCRRFLDDRTCGAHDEIPIPDRYTQFNVSEAEPQKQTM